MKNSKTRTHSKYLIAVTAVILAVMLGASGCGNKAEDDSAGQQTSATEQTTVTEQTTQLETETEPQTTQPDQARIEYTFRYDDLLQSHYRKHGIDMGFDSPEEYLAAANAVIANPEALTKTEAEDGDTVYYVESTNEFVVLSTDGYIRTYFLPDSGKRYFDRQ